MQIRDKGIGRGACDIFLGQKFQKAPNVPEQVRRMYSGAEDAAVGHGRDTLRSVQIRH